ncbi:DCST1 [Bugula neritina]|uniref:DCST1 n=1 Tax=Bugula neritina TaxID=10212 RepID=A0A7J7IWL0_BUGNE|nr:DCST1 [Bugula neritina]
MVAGMNYTYMSNETITNEVCLPMPTMLPTLLIRNIYLIFGAQLVMAFFEAYGLRMRRFIASIFYHKVEGSFKLLPCLKPSQKKKRCIVCDAKLKGNEMQICPKDKCHLFYCQECWQDIKGYCLGCTSPTELDQVLSNLVLQEKKS